MAVTVGIAGITGKFARCVLANLLKKSDVVIRGYCHDPTKLPDSIRFSSRIHLTQGQFDDTQAIASFVKGSDVVVCCYLGERQLMTEGQKLLIDACEAQGVKRYMASDYTLDFTKLQSGQLIAKDPMIMIKGYLETKTVEGVHVIIGAFMDTLWSGYFQIWDPTAETLSYWGTGEELWEFTSYENAAEFVAALAVDEKAVGLQKFLGDRQNIFQIAEVFEKVYGTKPRLEWRGSLEDLYEYMHQIQQTNPTNIFAYLALFYQYYSINGQTHLGIDVDGQSILDIKRVRLEDYLRSHPKSELATAVQTVGSNV